MCIRDRGYAEIDFTQVTCPIACIQIISIGITVFWRQMASVISTLRLLREAGAICPDGRRRRFCLLKIKTKKATKKACLKARLFDQ